MDLPDRWQESPADVKVYSSQIKDDWLWGIVNPYFIALRTTKYQFISKYSQSLSAIEESVPIAARYNHE
jgi:hypothetical protein